MKLGSSPTAPVLPIAMIGIFGNFPATALRTDYTRRQYARKGAQCLLLVDIFAKVLECAERVRVNLYGA
jgi:hypothetical protein